MKKRSLLLNTIKVLICIALTLVTLGYGYYVDFDIIFYCLLLITIVMIVLFAVLAINNKNQKYIKILETRLSLWNTISYRVKGAGETAFKELPVGVIILDNARNVMWSNSCAQHILLSPLKDKNLETVANGKVYNFIKKADDDATLDKYESKLVLFNKIYEVTYLKSLSAVYFEEVTERDNLIEKYDNRTMAIGYINIDNLEENLSELDIQIYFERQIHLSFLLDYQY